MPAGNQALLLGRGFDRISLAKGQMVSIVTALHKISSDRGRSDIQ